jgi:hypothetical protein
MKRSFYYDEIRSLFVNYKTLIQGDTLMNRSNRTVDAENIFGDILNIVFDWNLKNANETRQNQDCYDLVDKKKNTYVQVTSASNQPEKFRETITLFTHQEYPSPAKLIFLFISDKLSGTVKKLVADGKGRYEIYNISTLCKKIYHLSPGNQKAIYEILKEEVLPQIMREERVVLTPELLPQSPTPSNAGIVVNRYKLVKELFEFGQADNGLVIGGPGMGKSHTIDELQKFCNKKKIPCFIIRINELLEGTDEEIGRSLRISADWVNAFKTLNKTTKIASSFLIFDAFDTAKEEKIKENLLKQIKKAVSELSNHWTILVSTRTFDAYHSSRLLHMFPRENIYQQVYCRHFVVGPLSESELESAIPSSGMIKAQFTKTHPSLRELLRVPYFFKLFEIIVTDKIKLSKAEWSHIETEEQLLSFFWNSKVRKNEETDYFLQNLTEILVTEQNLSCKKTKIVTLENLAIFGHLSSLQILTASVTTGQSISFSHNILLDFAISKYLVPEDVKELSRYVENHPRHPFLFRQGFIYFYSRLWRLDRGMFWKHYFVVSDITTPLFRLFQQSILIFTIADLYRNIQDLTPILAQADSEDSVGNQLKLLQGIRFSSGSNLLTKHFLLFAEFSRNIKSRFIWDLGFLIGASIDYLEANPNKTLFQFMQTASQNYLEFALQERIKPEQKWMIDTNASTWAVQNICRTFQKSRRSEKLLLNLLAVLNEDDFPIRYFYVLQQSLIYLFQTSPKFATSVFNTLYLHIESSDRATQLGNSAVLSLTSNRKQDFQMIHYGLEKAYPDFLKLAPEIVTELGMTITNRYYKAPGRIGINKNSFLLKVNGQIARIIPDLSSYEYVSNKEDGPISFTSAIFKFVESQISENDQLSEDLVKLIIDKGQAGIIWKQLIKFIALHPEKLKISGFGILQNKSVYICDDTVQEAGELIRSIWEFLKHVEQIELEGVILSLQKNDLQEHEAGWENQKIARLLNCIPDFQQKRQQSKDILGKYGKLPNPPLTQYGGVHPYEPTADEKITRMGVDPNNSIEMGAYRLIENLSSFNARYNFNAQGLAPRTEFKALIPEAKKLFAVATGNNFNQKLQYHCETETIHFCQVLSRHRGELVEVERQFVEEVAFYYLELPKYKNVPYQPGNIKTSFGLGDNHPRYFACQCLIEILDSDSTEKILRTVLPLFSDPMQGIRLECNRILAWLWQSNHAEYLKIVTVRINRETDAMCLGGIINSTSYDNVIGLDQLVVEEIAKLTVIRLVQSKEKPADELWVLHIRLLLKLLFFYNSDTSGDIIQENLKVKFFAKVLIREIFTLIDPHHEGADYINQPDQFKKAFLILQNCLRIRFDHIEEKLQTKIDTIDDFEVLDSFVHQLNFTLEKGKASNKGKPITGANETAFYFKAKPLIQLFFQRSLNIDGGFIVSHTAYYLLELLNRMLASDPEYILSAVCEIVRCAAKGGLTYDQSTFQEILKLTQKLLADHKTLLYDEQNFSNLLMILDQFADSGWQEALEFTWKIKDVF